MPTLARPLAWLAVLALLGVALPTGAAPVPAGPGAAPPLEKYLPDDADMLVVLNVKELVRAPLFVKDHKKQVSAALAGPSCGPLFKAVGIDPLADVERIALVVGQSCFPETAPEGSPIFVVSGKFDLPGMRAGLAKLARVRGGTVEELDGPAGKLYRIENLTPLPMFVVPLDNHTFLMTGSREQAVEAIARAAGRKVGRLSVPGVAARVKKTSPDVVLQGFALERSIINGPETRVENVNGQKVVKHLYRKLGDDGVKEVEGRFNVKDDLHGRIVVTAKDAASLRKLLNAFNSMHDLVKPIVQAKAQEDPRHKPIAAFVNGVSIRAADGALILEARATADMVRALLDAARRAGVP